MIQRINNINALENDGFSLDEYKALPLALGKAPIRIEPVYSDALPTMHVSDRISLTFKIAQSSPAITT